QKDSDIASSIASANGLQADVTATTDQHEYLIQNNQTDMDFLRDRAARVGYRVRVDGTKLSFKPAETSPADAPEQEWGSTLISFHVRLTPVAQSDKAEVRGWDPKTKAAIVGTASSQTNPSAIGDGKT